MSLPTTYGELQTTILSMMDDVDANVDVARAIGLAEKRFNRILDMPEMETSTTLTASSSVALPTDFWKARSLHIETDPRVLLEPVSPATLRSRYNAQTTGKPEVYTIIGSNIILGPAPDSSYSLTLVYKGSITPLSDTNTSNFLLSKYTDIYIAGTLMFGELTVWNDVRAANLKSWWEEIMEEVAKAGREYKRGSAPRRLRSSVHGAC